MCHHQRDVPPPKGCALMKGTCHHQRDVPGAAAGSPPGQEHLRHLPLGSTQKAPAAQGSVSLLQPPLLKGEVSLGSCSSVLQLPVPGTVSGQHLLCRERAMSVGGCLTGSLLVLAVASVLQSSAASHTGSPRGFSHLQQRGQLCAGHTSVWLCGSLSHRNAACTTHFSHLPVKILLPCHVSLSTEPAQLCPSTGWHKTVQHSQTSRRSREALTQLQPGFSKPFLNRSGCSAFSAEGAQHHRVRQSSCISVTPEHQQHACVPPQGTSLLSA